MKYLVSLMIILVAANCGGGKKKAAMWWMALLGNQTAQTAETKSSAGDSVTTTNNDQTGTTGFSFQTTTTVPVSVTVADSNGPVQGAVVQVQDPSAANTVIFQAVTNETGQASGTFTVTLSVTDKDGDTVVVTGTRIRGAVPAGANLLTLDRGNIEESGRTTVQDLLQTLPQVFPGSQGLRGIRHRHTAHRTGRQRPIIQPLPAKGRRRPELCFHKNPSTS